MSNRNVILSYLRYFLGFLQLDVFGPKDANTKNTCAKDAYAGNTYSGNGCIKNAFIRGAYAGDTYIKGICIWNTYIRDIYVRNAII